MWSERLKFWWRGGPRPKRTPVELARVIAESHKVHSEASAELAEIARVQRDQQHGAHATIAALIPPATPSK